jgi:Cu(I)/Ag(I) efflux system membrane fusion protein
MMASVARERFLQRNRLAAADVPESVLADIEKVRRVHDTVPVLAEHDGVVTGIGAREGAFVTPAQMVLGYADLGVVWAELTLSPEQLDTIGQSARVALRPLGQPNIVETVSFNTSQAIVDPASHVARLRVPLRSKGNQFRAGTLIEADIRLPGRKAMMVRKDSVIRTGHGEFVIVADGGDHFRQVAVRLGAETREEVEVVSGLVPGQKVIVNGQFLLGSEASLQASRQRMAPRPAQ